MTSTVEYMTWTIGTSNSTLCQPSGEIIILASSVVPSIAIILNTISLLAICCATHQSPKARIFVYVKSMLASNIVIDLLGGYILLNVSLLIERPIGSFPYENRNVYNKHDPSHVNLMQWYLWRKSYTLAFGVIMCSNVVALVDALKDQIVFPALPVADDEESVRQRSSHHYKRRSPVYKSISQFRRQIKKRKAYIIVLVTWLIPLIYCTTTTIIWNECIDECTCFSGNYLDRTACSENVPYCSKEWFPVSKKFLVGIEVFWTLETIVLLIVIYKCIASHQRNSTLSQVMIDFVHHNNDMDDGETISSTASGLESVCDQNVIEITRHPSNTINSAVERIDVIEQDETNLGTIPSNPHRVERNPKLPKQRRGALTSTSASRFSSFNPKLKLAIALTVTMIVCTTPLSVRYLIDIVTPVRNERTAFGLEVSAHMLFQLYTVISPVLLMHYLSDLNKATVNFLLKMYCFRRVEVTRSRSDPASRC